MVQTSPRRAIGESVEEILVAKRKEGEAHASAVEKEIDQRMYTLGVYPAAFWREAHAGGDQDCGGGRE